MKKSIILAIIIIIIAVITGGLVLSSKKGTNDKNVANISLESAEDMQNLIEQIYEKSGNDMFGLETRELDINDEMELASYTGLTSNENIDKVVVSESMITSTAYSLALVKVKEDSDVESIKREMVDNVDMRKWICVCADRVYATNYDNVIFLVMASEENAKPQYDAFKEIVGGNVGKELARELEELDF